MRVVVLVVLGGLLLRWSRRAEWTRAHVLLVAGAVLLIRAVLASAVDPGFSSAAARYVSSAVVLVAVLALLAWAWIRTRRDERLA